MTDQTSTASASAIRLARILVADAAKHGTSVSAKIHTIARMKTSEERRRAS